MRIIAFLALLATLSACRRTYQCTSPGCPAFPESVAKDILPTDSGAALPFTDGTHRVDFLTTRSYKSPEQLTTGYTTSSPDQCGDPALCYATAIWKAEAAANSDHPAISFEYTAAFGDTSLPATRSAANISLRWTPGGRTYYFQYTPQLGDPLRGDHIELSFRLGNRIFDQVVVLEAERSNGRLPDIWRVYFAYPGGIVGFESSYTNSLFWRE